MQNPEWKFFLANSDDLSVNADITNQSRDKTLTVSHNRPGSFSFNTNLTLENVDYTQTLNKCVLCVKNGVIVWSGPIWSRNIDFVEEKIECEAVGWFEILMHRYIIPPDIPDFTNGGVGTNEGEIAHYLLNYANAIEPTWIIAGSDSANITKRKLVNEPWQSIGEEIINLSDMEDGFDMNVHPVDRTFNVFEWNEYDDRTEIQFQFNAGIDNIAKINVKELGGEMRNDVYAIGEENIVNHSVSTSTSIEENNMLQAVIQATEITDTTILAAISESEIALKDFPPLEFEIELKPTGQGNPYSIFEDYNIGDKIYVDAVKRLSTNTGKQETIRISGSPRIFGASISIDENSVERVTSLRTTYSGG